MLNCSGRPFVTFFTKPYGVAHSRSNESQCTNLVRIERIGRGFNRVMLVRRAMLCTADTRNTQDTNSRKNTQTPHNNHSIATKPLLRSNHDD
jgi:hypothetical protein